MNSPPAPVSPKSSTPGVEPLFAIFGRVVATFALAAVGAALVTELIAVIVAGRGDRPPPTWAPEKAARVAFIPLFIVGYVASGARARRRAGLGFRRAAALTDLGARRRDVAVGFGAGVLTICAMLAAEVAAGWWRVREPGDPWPTVLRRAATYLPLGLLLATWEEGLFRGLLFGEAERARGRGVAVLFSSAIFGVSHLIGPEGPARTAWDAPWVGARAAWANVSGIVLRLDGEWRLFAGLTLVGVVLALLRAKTGSAWLGVGVHAGWYFVQQMDGRFLSFALPSNDPIRPWSGGPDYADGVAGWCALAATYLAAARFVPKIAPRTEPSP